MRYGNERHNERLMRLEQRWRKSLDDQRDATDAAPRRTPDLAPAGADADAPTLSHGRIVDTERDGS